VNELELLLEPFSAEIDQLKSGELTLKDPLSQGADIEHGIIGLLDSVLEKSGTKLEFDPSRRAMAAKLERRARRDKKKGLARVLRVYRDVARMYPDVLGTGYGGTPDDFEEFRRVTIPRLLRAVETWADENQDTALDALRDVKAAWDTCIESDA
jgi:hypothetical protein